MASGTSVALGTKIQASGTYRILTLSFPSWICPLFCLCVSQRVLKERQDDDGGGCLPQRESEPVAQPQTVTFPLISGSVTDGSRDRDIASMRIFTEGAESISLHEAPWHFLSWRGLPKTEPRQISSLVKLSPLEPSFFDTQHWLASGRPFFYNLCNWSQSKRIATWLNRFLYCGRVRIFLYKYDTKCKKTWNKIWKQSLKKDLIHYYPQKAELRGMSAWKCWSLQPWALCAVVCVSKHSVLLAREGECELGEFSCYFQFDLISIYVGHGIVRPYRSRRINHNLLNAQSAM